MLDADPSLEVATDVAGLLPEVEDLMRRICAGDEGGADVADPLGAICAEHLATGGKRIRARLALAAVDALGGEARQALGWAAACELLHNATLIHDDLQDGDEVRRGQPTVWAKHGSAQAINAGDLMLMAPFRAVEALVAPAEVKLDLCQAVSRHAITTVRGQAIELELLARPDLENGALKSAYLRGIEGKTSALFELPVEGGARLTGRSAEEARRLAKPFRGLGMLFQYQDDVLDLYGDKGREAPGADLREGKVSSLVVEHLALKPGDREWLLRVLQTPREETRSEDVQRAIDSFRASGALEAVLGEIRSLAQALSHADLLQGSPVLGGMVGEFLELILRPIRHVLESSEAPQRVAASL